MPGWSAKRSLALLLAAQPTHLPDPAGGALPKLVAGCNSWGRGDAAHTPKDRALPP